MTKFCTSDTHFNHRNIIKYCNRPFKSETEMDLKMIQNWNDVVGPNDIVYHVGDFAFTRTQEILDAYFEILNGKKILIVGNHDSERVTKHPGWYQVHRDLMMKDGGRHIHMYHYPISSWDRSYHGSIHLHGHTHGKHEAGFWPDGSKKKVMDVGVDSNNFRPISFDEIFEEFEKDEYKKR